jgi:hypothetical protein
MLPLIMAATISYWFSHAYYPSALFSICGPLHATLSYSSNLKLEAAGLKKLAPIYQTTEYYIPEAVEGQA